MKHFSQTPVWAEYLLLALITLLAAALRVYKLGEWSSFIDEMRTWDDAVRSASNPLLSLLYLNSHQAFSLITKLSLDTFGVSAISLRLFPCIVGILTIPLMYFPFKALFNARTSLIAVSIIAVSPWHVYMSQMARWYTLLVLLMFLSLFSFYMFVDHNNIKYLFIYVILCILSLTLHLTAFFVPMIAVVYMCLLLLIPKFRNDVISAKRLLVVLTIHAVLALATLSTFVSFIQQMAADQELMGSFGRDFLLKALYHVTPSVTCIAAAGLILLWGMADRRGAFLAVYWLLPVVMLTIFLTLQMNVSARYLLFTFPPITLAVGVIAIYVKDLPVKYNTLLFLTLLASALLPSLQADYLYFTSEYGYRDRLKEAFQYVNKYIADDDLVFVTTGFAPYDSSFYIKAVAKLENVDIKDEQLIATSWLENLDHRKRIWVIAIGRVSEDQDGFREWLAEKAHLLVEFSARRGTQDQTVKVYVYSI